MRKKAGEGDEAHGAMDGWTKQGETRGIEEAEKACLVYASANPDHEFWAIRPRLNQKGDQKIASVSTKATF